MTNATTPAPRDERKLFEAAYLKAYFYPAQRWSLVPEKYRTNHAEIAWRSWQERAAIAESELAEVREQLRRAMDEASSLALSIWKTHFKESAPQLELCDTAAGVISQIDNMYCGLRAELERVKKDAVRYQWLRDQHNDERSDIGVYDGHLILTICDGELDLDKGVDRAIDASRDGKGGAS